MREQQSLRSPPLALNDHFCSRVCIRAATPQDYVLVAHQKKSVRQYDDSVKQRPRPPTSKRRGLTAHALVEVHRKKLDVVHTDSAGFESTFEALPTSSCVDALQNVVHLRDTEKGPCTDRTTQATIIWLSR